MNVPLVLPTSTHVLEPVIEIRRARVIVLLVVPLVLLASTMFRSLHFCA